LLTLFVLLLAALTARADNLRPYAVDSEGEGRPVWLIPGLASPGWVWDDLAERLRDAGYRTHVVTLAGFAGQPPLDSDQPFLPTVRERLADELRNEAGKKPIVIGHSLGGFLAFWLAATTGEQLAGAIAVDGVPYLGGLMDPSATPESQRAGAEQMAAFMTTLSAEQYQQQNRMSLGTMISDPAMVERVAADSGRSDPATVGRAMFELMTTDLRPQMRTVEIPVLLVQAADSGSNDAMRAAFGRQLADIPDHRHVVAEQGRHFVQLDDPEFLAREVLAFLAAIEQDADHE
jgi:pimeloyl-ACP methyl ester carboxylesterase